MTNGYFTRCIYLVNPINEPISELDTIENPELIDFKKEVSEALNRKIEMV